MNKELEPKIDNSANLLPSSKGQAIRRRIGAGILGASLLLGVGAAVENQTHIGERVNTAISEALNTDQDLVFSESFDTITTQGGDNIWDIAGLVEGSPEVDYTQDIIDYITSNPANADIFDENGKLKTNIQVTYPMSVQIAQS